MLNSRNRFRCFIRQLQAHGWILWVAALLLFSSVMMAFKLKVRDRNSSRYTSLFKSIHTQITSLAVMKGLKGWVGSLRESKNSINSKMVN